MVLFVGSLAAQAPYPTRTNKKENWERVDEFRRSAGQHSTASRAAIWTEDFGTGVPAGWGISTTGNPLVQWYHTTDGHQSSDGTEDILSTSALNGWMIVDSGHDGNSTSPWENTKLTSKAITTGVPFPARVKLEFQQMFRDWADDSTIVAVSPDSIVWTEYLINTEVDGMGTANPDLVILDISSAIGGADSCYIRFDWRGQFEYGWQIDDVSIAPMDNHDIGIQYPYFDHEVEYTQVPLSQVRASRFYSEIKNMGIQSENNASLHATVTSPSGPVFSGSSVATTLGIGAIDSVHLSADFTASEWGLHTISYNVDMDSTDQYLVNNSRTKSFDVTDGTFALDNGIRGGRLSGGGTVGNFNPFLWAIAFELPNDEIISSLTFFVDENSLPGANVTVLLYNASNFTTLFARSDYTIKLEDLGNWVTVYFRDALAGTWEYNASARTYLAGVKFNGGGLPAYIGSSTNRSREQWVYEYDYGDAAWYTSFTVPMMRLNVGHDPLAGMQETMVNHFGLQQNQPNPFDGQTTVNFELDKPSPVHFEVMDITGSKVLDKSLGIKAAGKHSLTLDASNYRAGVYFYSISTDSGRQQKKMVVR